MVIFASLFLFYFSISPMLPTKFRRQLRREADLWVEEGAIVGVAYRR
jgi:hypothetical protein